MERVEDVNDVAVVLLAGGASTRFDAELSKVYVPLGGRPLLSFSLSTLERSAAVDHIVLVIREEDRSAAMEVVDAVAPAKLRAVVSGGATRHGSETAGLTAVRDLPGVRWVMVHDAARPFVTLDLLDALVDKAVSSDVGVIPGLPFDSAVVDEDGHVVDTSELITVQTPQLFEFRDAIEAYTAAEADGFTGVDTAETVAAYRETPIRYVDGDPRNLKITTLEDLWVAEQILAEWHEGRWLDGVASH